MSLLLLIGTIVAPLAAGIFVCSRDTYDMKKEYNPISNQKLTEYDIIRMHKFIQKNK